MITRSRSDYVSGEDETVSFNCIGPAPHGTPSHASKTFVFNWDGFYRNQEDTFGEKGGGRRSWKNFEHYKSVSGSYSGSMIPFYTEEWASNPHFHVGRPRNIQAGYHQWWYGSELEPYGSPGMLNNGLTSFKVPRTGGGFIPEPAGLDDLIVASLRAMMPGIKSEMSLINSVIELKDFRSMGRTLWSLTRQGAGSGILRQALATMRDAWRRGIPATLRELSRNASGGFLSWKFALQPLLSDIAAFQAALSRTERRMNDLLTRSGRVQRRHFSHNWREFKDTYHVGSNPGFGYVTSSLRTVGLYDVDRTVNYQPTTFHAEIEYSYYLTRYQREHARILSLLDSFGINLNPAIIWNAIPWSFVVDWVVGVSQWLESMGSSNMEPMINVRRYLWSVKRERSILVSKGITRSYYGLPPEQRAHMPVVTETAYRRQVGIPSWNSFYMSGISSNELMLGAALVLANRRRRRNRR